MPCKESMLHGSHQLVLCKTQFLKPVLQGFYSRLWIPHRVRSCHLPPTQTVKLCSTIHLPQLFSQRVLLLQSAVWDSWCALAEWKSSSFWSKSFNNQMRSSSLIQQPTTNYPDALQPAYKLLGPCCTKNPKPCRCKSSSHSIYREYFWHIH